MLLLLLPQCFWTVCRTRLPLRKLNKSSCLSPLTPWSPSKLHCLSTSCSWRARGMNFSSACNHCWNGQLVSYITWLHTSSTYVCNIHIHFIIYSCWHKASLLSVMTWVWWWWCMCAFGKQAQEGICPMLYLHPTPHVIRIQLVLPFISWNLTLSPHEEISKYNTDVCNKTQS